jgi:hypothetical protein
MIKKPAASAAGFSLDFTFINAERSPHKLDTVLRNLQATLLGVDGLAARYRQSEGLNIPARKQP